MKRTLALGLFFSWGCGGSAEPARASDSPDTKAAADSETPAAEEKQSEASEPGEDEPGPNTLPTECAKSTDGICLPPKGFVDRLCNDVYPDIALAMFAKGTAWTRGYLTRETKAWNASGGAASDGMLAFDEEVLVLRHRAPPKDGVQISGMGGYDVLRWDGSCVTLATEEMTTRLPPAAKHAAVEWRKLDDGMQDALRGSEAVTKAFREQRAECKGATMGSVTKKCEKLTTALSAAVVAHVRGGGAVGTPTHMPE